MENPGQIFENRANHTFAAPTEMILNLGKATDVVICWPLIFV